MPRSGLAKATAACRSAGCFESGVEARKSVSFTRLMIHKSLARADGIGEMMMGKLQGTDARQHPCVSLRSSNVPDKARGSL
jgi:hypothetical protein